MRFFFRLLSHFFLITCGISTCKTSRSASLHILTSWLPYFQTVLLFSTIFSSFPSFSKALSVSSSSTVQTVFLRVNRSCLLLGYKGFRHPAGGNSWQSTRPQDMSPSTNPAEIVAENTLKPRPEIASSCCCHRRGCFYARSPPSYETDWLHAGLVARECIPACPASTVGERVSQIARGRTVDSRVATSEVAFCADRPTSRS